MASYRHREPDAGQEDSSSGALDHGSCRQRLDALAIQSAVGDIASFASWIGREVASSDGAFRSTGDPRSFAVPQLEGTERIEAVVQTLSGVPLRTMTVTADDSGRAIWDGLDSNANPIVGQDLKINLRYLQGGSVVEARDAEVLRLVTGIRGSEDGPVLDLADGSSLAPSAISRLQDAQPGGT